MIWNYIFKILKLSTLFSNFLASYDALLDAKNTYHKTNIPILKQVNKETLSNEWAKRYVFLLCRV